MIPDREMRLGDILSERASSCESVPCAPLIPAWSIQCSTAMTPEDVARWSRLLPQTQVVVLESAGHLLHHFPDSPEAYLTVLDQLIEESRATEGSVS